jgi:hypothetical protein
LIKQRKIPVRKYVEIKISDYVGSRRKMEKRISVLIGSPWYRMKLPGSHTTAVRTSNPPFLISVLLINFCVAGDHNTSIPSYSAGSKIQV